MSTPPLPARPGRGAIVESDRADFEVLPPESHAAAFKAPKDKALAWLIQYFMDNLLRIPGTRSRVGLTPFLDLIPIFGDGAVVVISAITIVEGARRRVPKIVLARMGMNVLLNGLIGTIPAVGEVFSFWFKPSYRNYLLLQKYSVDSTTATGHATTRDWIFVVGLLVALLIIAALFIGAAAYVSYQFFHTLLHPGAR